MPLCTGSDWRTWVPGPLRSRYFLLGADSPDLEELSAMAPKATFWSNSHVQGSGKLLQPSDTRCKEERRKQ